LALSAGASPISYIATLTVLSPSGRRMTRSRNFYKKLKTP
jgi:hypothetical protein